MPDIQHLPLAELKPWPRNARIHSRRQVKQLAQSIRRFGFTHPILVDEDNRILAGHGRMRAAAELGLAAVPCLRITHLSPAEKRAYVLADNKLALNAQWDHKLLAEELGGLLAEDVAFDIGFSVVEMDGLIAGSSSEEEDADPGKSAAADAPARCRDGDIWQLGPNLLACGAALQPDAVNALIAGQAVQMLILRSAGAAADAQPGENGEWAGAMLLSAEKAGSRVVLSEGDVRHCDRIIMSWEARTKIAASRCYSETAKEAARVTP
ncbi:MAG: ParB/Srx family N-terminal domain-containing protein [Parvibaculaceae bacterium]